jgi:hypothetical protein
VPELAGVRRAIGAHIGGKGEARMSKYSNVQTAVGEKVFASKKEARRFSELSLLERAGEIEGLRCQVPYVLVPRQTVNGFTERAIIYISDFEYHDRQGKLHVEDAKGFRTPDYIIKRKLMLWFWKIKIEEV